MDERERCFVIKFLWLQEQGSKAICAHLRGTLGDLAVSLPTVKRWSHRFSEGDTSGEDRNRAGIPLTILKDVLSKFLSKYPFAPAKNIASHFHISVSTVKDLLARGWDSVNLLGDGCLIPYRRVRKMNQLLNQCCFPTCCHVIKRPISMRLQPEMSRGSDTRIQLAPCMPDPGVTSLLASAVESTHQKL
jgi:hypothetical protein